MLLSRLTVALFQRHSSPRHRYADLITAISEVPLSPPPLPCHIHQHHTMQFRSNPDSRWNHEKRKKPFHLFNLEANQLRFGAASSSSTRFL